MGEEWEGEEKEEKERKEGSETLLFPSFFLFIPFFPYLSCSMFCQLQARACYTLSIRQCVDSYSL